MILKLKHILALVCRPLSTILVQAQDDYFVSGSITRFTNLESIAAISIRIEGISTGVKTKDAGSYY